MCWRRAVGVRNIVCHPPLGLFQFCLHHNPDPVVNFLVDLRNDASVYRLSLFLVRLSLAQIAHIFMVEKSHFVISPNSVSCRLSLFLPRLMISVRGGRGGLSGDLHPVARRAGRGRVDRAGDRGTGRGG